MPKDSELLLLSANRFFVEGVHLDHKRRTVLGHQLAWVNPATPGLAEGDPPVAATVSASFDLTAPLTSLLEGAGWKGLPVVLVLPTSELIFRKLHFPFSDARKISKALPFELESELVEDFSQLEYVHHLQPEGEGTQVLVALAPRMLLESAGEVFFEHDLHLRSIDHAAVALHLMRPLTEGESGFLGYVGPEEAFVVVIREGKLANIVHFAHGIGKLLRAHAAILPTLPELLGGFASRGNGSDTEPQAEWLSGADDFQQELAWLAAQFTRTFRLQGLVAESEIRFHGIFSPFLEWDGLAVRLRSLPLPEAQDFLQGVSPAPDLSSTGEDEDTLDLLFNEDLEDEAEASEKTPETLAELKQQAKARDQETPEDDEDFPENETLPMLADVGLPLEGGTPSLKTLEGRKAWGIAGDLHTLASLLQDAHPLRLYTQTLPWRRFVKRHRWGLALAALLLIALAGVFGFRLHNAQVLLRQEIAQTEQQVRSQLQQVLGSPIATTIPGQLEELRTLIEKRRNQIEVSQSFLQRDYRMLDFLSRFSGLLAQEPGSGVYRIDRLEYGDSRFSISGLIDSYDRLQLLKTRLKALPEFTDQRVVESNRKSPDGIVFRISIDL
ncbi:MAG: hypothetical protein VX610_03475 [SAR324 cluster bacterium]|nr:hypothetical protein [SAR324 cluster bacterium]